MKTCTKCKIEKPLEEFYRNSLDSTGRHSACKSCMNARERAYRATPKAKALMKARQKRRLEKLRTREHIEIPAKAKCSGCGEVKPSSEFWRRRIQPNGLDYNCKMCRAIYNRRYRYGLSVEQFEQLRSHQGGVCAICLKRLGNGHGCHVDHDHSSKKVRGLLCNACNRGLGGFRDNLGSLLSAFYYLTEPPAYTLLEEELKKEK